MKKWANKLNKNFSEEELQMTKKKKKYMKKCSPSLAIKEMQINTTLRFHLTPIILLEWPTSRTQTTNVGKDVGKKESSYAVGGNVN
jgi:hypothetical protein